MRAGVAISCQVSGHRRDLRNHQILCQRSDRAIFHPRKLIPVANNAAEAKYAGAGSRKNGRTIGSLSSKFGNMDSDRCMSSPAAV